MTRQYSVFINLFQLLKSPFILIFLLTVIINLLGICVALYSMQIFDKVINSGSLETLIYLTLITIVVIFFICFFYELRLLIMFKLSNKIFKYLMYDINHNKTKKLKLDQYQILDKIKNFFNQNYCIIFFEIIVSSSYLIALYLVHFVVFLFALFCVLALLLIDFLLFKKNLLYLKNSQIKSNINNNINMLLSDQNLVNKHQRLIEKISKTYQKDFMIAAKSQESQMYYNIKNNYINRNTRIFFQVLSTMIGAYLVILNEISLGSIIAISILLAKFLEPFSNFSYNYLQVKEAISNLKKFFLTDNLVSEKIIFNDDIVTIHFDNISYFDELYCSKINIDNLFFKKGDAVGIIAKNPYEKMAIYNLLAKKIYPDRGTLRINNFNFNNLQIDNFIDVLDGESMILDGDIFSNISPDLYKLKYQQIYELIIETGFMEDLEFLIKNSQIDLNKIDQNLKNIIVILRILFDLPKVLFVKNSDLLFCNKVFNNIFFKKIKDQLTTTFLVNPNPFLIKNCNYLVIFKKGGTEVISSNQFLKQYEKNATLLPK